MKTSRASLQFRILDIELTDENAFASQLASLAENSPAMLWRGDSTGRCVYLNAPMRNFWGLTLDQCGEFDWATSLLPEDHEAVFGPFAIGMKSHEGFVCEGRYRRHDGEVRILRTKATPYTDAHGHFAGMIGVNEDITELRDAERDLGRRNTELREATKRHLAIADRLKLATSISGLAMSEHDAALRYTWAHNVSGDPLGKTPAELVGPDIGRPLEAILERTLSTGEPQSEELAMVFDGKPIWIAIQTSAVERRGGETSVVASALDITARKLNEQKLEVLARELSHRVKNVFSLVEAIVRQSARLSDVPKEFVLGLESRIQALAKAQDSLAVMDDDRVDLSVLLAGQLSHLSGISMSGPAVHVAGRAAPYISLAVHELGTNAVKYGSLSAPDGTVELSWGLAEDDQIAMIWREQGGPRPVGGEKRGFGSNLLTRIFAAATYGTAEMTLGDTGLVWEARMPRAEAILNAPRAEGG
ncbi:sensor histidine kinase [Shinella sp.]|uniref:sensor histidine kinase n=1 Tax=Shinella sp. TaxID=1870904 RepID=UPI003F716F39